MGRNKKYNLSEVTEKMKKIFIKKGYEATSIDDLVKATGLLRGSLYAQFGSKLKMFSSVLNSSLSMKEISSDLDIILIALMELCPRNKQIQLIISNWYKKFKQDDINNLLINRIIYRSGIMNEVNDNEK
ncbi:TetR/AcrR family transcriptional regulator [Apilactobacillus micheneri]|uniref:TetR/AcrR family transcriptional regulator n=2 Tax=Apilactobacillus micheneri TaxID=1899430 RepID=A0A9Q8ILV5_9LACO|nr:TetR/AcrR family transcriptional regulator [Apilactobacillus micheneri]TPR26192.1 TetR/AcrR family transcriptional regulator [Apilactobacillus micheneri]TPR26946.1 TetR/AcrR family transcriptional regulator [Apilactobacillus micheneri]TPR27804.1 TetR/AcrR family transcriptional regulator [Apilactobacillus micheneri]TPR31709.1 TetR/AcrR family transcriptional regulator [Apilactobacillus micheneri]TPR32113.1 TetR/AcrR family transcriptional regulator [Apilactobacillus micheneri]